jgi:hypothetical protein
MSESINKECRGCKGCAATEDCYMRTWYEIDGIKMVCPCSICLVKTMCQQNCDLIREYGNFIPEPLYCAD